MLKMHVIGNNLMEKIIIFLKRIKALYLKYNFCFFKTIVANFRLFPFWQAVHLPLVIYNPTQLLLSKSKIKLKCKPKFRLIKWGYNQDLFVPSKTQSLLMMINGTIIVNGPIRISPGAVFRIQGKIEFDKYIEVGGGCKFLINNKCFIGSKTRFAFGSIICDTNYHYILENGFVHSKNGNIFVGKSVWVGNSCSIVKGANIPDGAIVSNKSFVNKDFSNYTNILIAGIPAKIIKKNCTQIRSPKKEKELDIYFHKITNTKYYMTSEYQDDDDLSMYFI